MFTFSHLNLSFFFSCVGALGAYTLEVKATRPPVEMAYVGVTFPYYYGSISSSTSELVVVEFYNRVYLPKSVPVDHL